MTTPRHRLPGEYARETADAVPQDTEQQVGVRDLKARLSEYLREVKSGATIVVTEHGRPVARLVPEPVSLRARLLALARAGDIVWNGESYAPSRPKVRVRGARTIADLVTEERDRE